MSKNRYTDIVCAVILVVTLVLTLLFMNGESLGVVKAESDQAADTEGAFSDRDFVDSWNDSSSVQIALDSMENLSNKGAYSLNGDLYLVEKGTYVLSGNLDGHQVIVNAKGAKLQIVLNGVNITEEAQPAILVEKADKVFLTLAEESTNTITVGKILNADQSGIPDAGIYSAADLTVNGTGSLSVSVEEGHGIKSTEDLVITNGNLTVDAGSTALLGKDSVRIADGSFDLHAGTDGIKANEDSKEEKGYVRIVGGTIEIQAEHDGIQAETVVEVEGGVLDITAGGGSENAGKKTEEFGRDGFAGGFGGGFGNRNFGDKNSGNRNNRDAGSEGTDAAEENAVKNNFRKGGFGGDDQEQPQMPEDGEQPQMPEGGEQPQMPEGGEQPQMPEGGEQPQMPEGGEQPQMPEGGEQPQMPEGGEQPQMPEGGEQPQMPEGMEQPQMPEGGEQPQMPEGIEQPQMPEGGEQPQMPEDGEQPQVSEKENNPQTEGDEDAEGTSQTDMTEASDSSSSDSYKGIKAGSQISVSGGDLTVNSKEDGLHSDGSLQISGGTVTISAGDDGIHAENLLEVTGGTIQITESYEGMEGKQILISDGIIDLCSSDDGMNASDGSSTMGFGFFQNSNGDTGDLPLLRITGGTVHVDAGGDGLDSNGNLFIEGGEILVDGPSNSGNGALDSGSESGGDLAVYGGTILALGASGMAETFSENSTQYSFLCTFEQNYQQGDVIEIQDEDGTVLYSYTAEKTGNSVVFSSPELMQGKTYKVLAGSQSKEMTMDSISNGAGFSMGGFFGGGKQRG